jgi:shikimate kinase
LSNGEDRHFLVSRSVVTTLERLGVKGKRAIVRVDSQIPVAKGLKSSSAISNAVVLATMGAVQREIAESRIQDVLDIAVDASLGSKASITGAYDDASACLLGGLVVTDNKTRKIVKRIEVDERLRVLIHVPKKDTKFTADVDPRKIQPFAKLSLLSYDLALQGSYLDAMKLNGLLQSAAFGYSTEVITSALMSGAIAAGLSGKGPAVAALCYESDVKEVLDSWGKGPEGFIIKCNTNNRRGGLLE